MKILTDIVETARRLEHQACNFKIITRITIDEALDFYRASGRFPNDKEIDSISFIGIERTIDFIFQFGKPFVVPRTMLASFEKLTSARMRFTEACKSALNKFFK